MNSPITVTYQRIDIIRERKPRLSTILRRQNHEQMIASYKVERGCMRCGYDSDPLELELHFRDLDESQFTISELVQFPRKRLRHALRIAEVYCARCHPLVHEALSVQQSHDVVENLKPGQPSREPVDNPKRAHDLINIDYEFRTATCSVCGTTDIFIDPRAKYGVRGCFCMNQVRESLQKYSQSARTKGRQSRHEVSGIDFETMTGICSVCGPTDIGIRKDQGKYIYFYCNTKKKADSITYSRTRGSLPRPSYTSHHHLSQPDDDNQTAVCSICGPVRIYIIHCGNGTIKRRCENAQKKYPKQALQNNQLFIDEYKVRLGCQRCGYNGDPLSLQLHSVISCKIVAKFSHKVIVNKKRLVQELEKCEVYCVNCHPLVHIEAFPIK
jgi:hypothetical protein